MFIIFNIIFVILCKYNYFLRKAKHTNLSGTVSTLKDVDWQTSHQSRKDLVELFEVLQCIEHQGFLCCLSSLTRIFTQFFTEQSQVARFKHHLEKHKEHLLSIVSVYRLP